MKKIILCTLFFIFALGFVPTSAYNVPEEYQTYIDNINGNNGNGNDFFWQDITGIPLMYHTEYTISANYGDMTYFASNNVDSIIATANNTNNMFYLPRQDIHINMVSDSQYSVNETYTYTTNLLLPPLWGDPSYSNSFKIQNGNLLNGGVLSSIESRTYTYSDSGTLQEILSNLARKCRGINIYVDGVLWSSVGGSYSIETEIELPCDIQAVDSSFNFFNGGYGVTWKQGQYNWTQTGPLENVTRTMVWTVSYPTVSYVQSLYNQAFVDSTPLDVVRNAFNTVFNSGTSIYDIPEQYRATTNFFINIDSPELGSSYHTSYDSTTQQWALTQNEYSYSLVNGYEFNTGFFKQLYQLYGDADLFSIALCYITPVRVSMYAVDDTQGIIYNPLSIYWLDLKQSNGTVLEYRNFGSQTTVSDDNVTDDTSSNDSVTGGDSPFVNPSEDQLNTNYNNSIQNSYNHTVNNYYNYNDINTDLLDYYLSFRDGGTEQDVQDAFGYLNSTISSLSNVPVVLHNLFYNFFPLPVVRLMQALFIVFMVFMIIIIIKHLFR